MILFVTVLILTNGFFISKAFAFAGSVTLSSNGGNCNLVGSWDMDTKTCTLNDDISGPIEISGNDITLDGNNHILKRGGSERTGINVYGSSGVVIKNLNIEDFTNSIIFQSVSNSTIQNVSISNPGSYGLFMQGGQRNKFLDSSITGGYMGIWTDSGGHTISGNTFKNIGTYGIKLSFQKASNILIENNIFEGNNYGIYSQYNKNNIIKENTFRDNTGPAYYEDDSGANGTIIVQNNFINNGLRWNEGQTSFRVYSTLSQDLPIGGNYWSDFDSILEGCSDRDKNRICDSPKYINVYNLSMADFLPWNIENGWSSQIIPEKAITSFSFKSLTPIVDGIIDEANHTITLTVPFSTDVTAIVPTIIISSDASINPNDNASQDFSSPVIYTVTSTDMSTQTYTVTVIVALPTHNPVILIPGITGTYLLKDYGDKEEIWPAISKVIISPFDNYLRDLELLPNGDENLDFPMKVGDIIRGVSLPIINDVHIFDRLISELIDNGGYVEGEDLFVFPYDWRFSSTKNAELLNRKINQIINDTGKEKVDIIAHSMGGLVAKEYIKENGQDKVDKLIFLGTPQLGAPKAFKTLMFGDDMGVGLFIFGLNHDIVKIISQNMPSLFELLPSTKYVENNGSYIINAFDKKIPPINLDYNQTKDFMIEKGRNPLMFPFAGDLHNSIDNLDLSNIETYNFVGCGTKTIGGITIKQKLSWDFSGFHMADDFDLKYVNGDETVPLESANKTIGASMYFAKGNTHGSLPSAEGVRQSILSILKGEELQNYPNILADASTCNISGKIVSTHSPVELHIYDEALNHTGPKPDGDIENNIMGVQYDVIDGEKFAFLPDGVDYKIVVKATDIGGYNFQIKDLTKNDEVINTYDWILIPLETLQAKGEISVGPDYPTSEYKITMDNNGDNIPDSTISSNIPVDFKFYLNVLRKAVDLLGLEQKTEEAILNKIDKVEKEYDKGKEEKTSEELSKLLEKVNNGNGQLKNISLTEKSVIVNSINTLLDTFK